VKLHGIETRIDMSKVLADSHAVLDQDRLFAQHQAALTLLQSRVQNPKITEFHWLDLACGRGQIIAHLDGNLTPPARAKISYHIYDVKAGYVSTTRKKADLLGFKSVSQITDSLAKLDGHFAQKEAFDFITFTNTVHELSPRLVAATLVSCLLMLKPKGSMFVYDFESFPPGEQELGAILWTRAEVKAIADAMLTALGVKNYPPEVGQWRHKSCTGWNTHVEREHFDRTRDELMKLAAAAITATENAMIDILKVKYEQTKQVLNSFTENGAETDEEKQERTAAVFDFWALTRALEIKA
jgi:ubiquinone/menaquinone biosynthesis C-methylase UbiE